MSTEVAVTRKGVYQENGQWTFAGATKQFESRAEARAAYSTARAIPSDVKPVETAPTVPARRSTRGRKAKKATRNTGAVAKALAIFDKQPKAKRKDVLALGVKAGININTLKTQYQRWLHRGDK